MIRGIDQTLRGTRGAAVSIASFSACRLQFVGVGNVELRAVSREPIQPPTTPGIVGQGMRKVRIWEYPIVEGDLFVLMSDGISTRFDLHELAHLAAQPRRDPPRAAPQEPRRRVLRRGADGRGGAHVSRPSRFPKALTVSPRAPCVLPIASEDERLWASGEARKFAAELGFSPDDQARIAVCVAELASNAVKHGGGGRVELHEVIGPTPGCRVRVEDHGPGISAVDEALRDELLGGALADGRRALERAARAGRRARSGAPADERRAGSLELGRGFDNRGGALAKAEPAFREKEMTTCRMRSPRRLWRR